MRAVHDRVIIEIEDLPEKSDGGIWIPQTAERRDYIGTVHAIGPNTPRLKLEGVKPGDKVLYNQYSELVTIAGVNYRICKEEHILAKLPKKMESRAGEVRKHATQTSKEWTDLD